MVHSRKEGLVYSGLTASIPGGDEAGGAGHTPGLWSLDVVPSGGVFGSAAGRAYGVSAKSASGYRTPVVFWRGIARPASAEGQANARLIAAAPTLFDYVAARASDGDVEAIRIMEGFNANS